VDGGPVSGATVDFEGVSGRTDSQGAFALSNVYTNAPGRITVSGEGFVTRGTRVQATSEKTGVMLDVIPMDFLTFYRYVARNNHDLPQVFLPTSRWTTDPSFYLKTTLEDVGEEVPPEIIGDIVRMLRNSVPELTDGKYRAVVVETGREVRPRVDGWINVTFRRSFPGGILGQALVGANPGTVEVVYDPARDLLPFANPGNCRSLTVRVAEHEVVHAMGFYHTDHSLEFQGPRCDGTGRSERLRRAAAIVYSRPKGNRDPDLDPFDTVLAQSVGALSPPIVSCDARHIGRF
jgi:hypothetical protein